jgi:RNA polymerase sigma-70 factor (ECF subfamily)
LVGELSAELEQCIPSPDDMECRIDRLVLRQALNGFLGTLSAEKRAVFLRRYWYLDPVAGIAKRYGLSQSKVKTMLFRMRKQLRDYFEREGYDL